MLDPRGCYRALQTRDVRFDGRLFVGVTTTGIYCRPVCPARPAKFDHCRFFASAAAAQEAGFRPCLRCRPETAPDLGSWRGTSNTVFRGLALITAGELDGERASVDWLAERLGVGARHLRRLFMQHLGASPVAVAQTRRVLFAKQLVHETRMPMGEIAQAAGFGSIRRFNETFQRLFHGPPSALRRKVGVSQEPQLVATGVTVRLRYRPPYDWAAMTAYLGARAIEGVERIDRGIYRRTVSHEGQTGTVEIVHRPDVQSLAATLRFPNVRALLALVARIRSGFDLGADVVTLGAHLAGDPWLAPLIAERPGLRVPGGWDGFELAVRAVLSQQVSVEAARQHAGDLVRACGAPVVAGHGDDFGLDRAFPSPAEVARADLGTLRVPRLRRQTIQGLAHAAAADPLLFQPLETVEKTVARLCAIRGVGEWTAHVIALRAAREPDAFPAGDAGLLRAAASRGGTRLSADDLVGHAERWRPWRAYAAQHLWAADAASRAPRLPSASGRRTRHDG
ncbi:MAG: AlkA N-terminal domain-containing protein [Polyangiaceae bacterium]|jgi:AraC family transcriptional regulator of adaptative response / DNA-3-methyladenine glycosylase II